MKKRSAEILQKILENPNEEFTIAKLMNGWHKTEKTLRNDLQEILDFMRINKMETALLFDGQSIKLNEQHYLSTLITQFYAMNLYHYKMSLEERKIYIIIVLLYQLDYYSMQQLADDMYVTRNTIVDDCKIVDQYLKTHQLAFIAKSKKGIKIEGNEEQIARILIEIFTTLLPNLSNENSFFSQLICQKAGFIYSLSDIAFHIESYTRDNNMIFAKESFQYVAICIFVLINRQLQVKHSLYSLNNTEQLPLDTIGFIVQYVLTKLGCNTINKNNILAIEKMILAEQKKPQIQSVNDFELYGVICHFLLEISREIHIDLQSDDLLIKSLISHIKTMHNWHDLDFDLEDDYGSFEFFKLRTLAESKYSILEKYLQYTMNRKMKNSIIIHICAALLRNRQNMDPYNVIISCPGSMATSKYLEAQIKNHFNFNVVDTMTTKQIERQKGVFDNIDFIISTVHIHDCQLPVVIVSPLIAFEDINKIQRFTFKKKQPMIDARQRFPVLAKIYSAYESSNNEKINYLNQELIKVLDGLTQQTIRNQQSILVEMLKLKYIAITTQRIDWKIAMKTAAQELINDGYFEKKYLKEAIDNVEEYGAYIIISNGIALAHGSKTSGVYHDGISLLVAKNGIYFDEGEEVNLLFFFSQQSDLDYLELFKELIKLGKDSSNIQKITALNDAADIYRCINNIVQ